MQRSTATLGDRKFDLLICGGGVYGAWTAYDAALRGLKVLLLDQGDWACGTSSASSKLIHGGLRYLETLDLWLVKKALKERQRLLLLAPHRVWPLRFGVPVTKNSRVGALRLKIGLSIYDGLAGALLTRQAHRRYAAQAFAERFPSLDQTGLNCGFTYPDAQTDDARLVLELIDGAQAAGAICLNYCRLTKIVQENGLNKEAMLHDEISGDNYSVMSSAIVMTSGQWLNISIADKKWSRLSKGVHLVLPKIPDNEALLLTAKSDGRVFFVMPWYGRTLVGTTDTNFNGDINQVTVERRDVDYLLSEVNLALTTNWTKQDIQGQFVGLRVLQYSPSHSPSGVSRDWVLKSSGKGLFFSIGGKITSSREDAAQIVDAVCRYLGKPAGCKTAISPFPWSPEQNYEQWSLEMSQKAASLGIDSESALWLLRRHGKHAPEVFRLIEQDQQLSKRLTADVPLIAADLMYCLEHEMVCHLEDLIRRRTPLIILYQMTKKQLQYYAEFTAKALKWDQDRIEREVDFCAEKWLLQ